MAVTDLEREATWSLWQYWSTAKPNKHWHDLDRYELYGVKYDPKLRELIKWRLGDPRLKQVE